ncbi:MAG: hypothetical protein V4687_16035 [Bacteroidota bacterium]
MTLEELEAAVKFVKDYTGLDPANSDEFKKGFTEKFYTEKDITSNKKLTGIATGFLSGKLTTKLKRDYKLDQADVEGKTIEEILDLAIQKAETEKEELKKQITDPGEGLKEIQAQLEKTKAQLDQEKEAKKLALKALEEKDKEYTTKELNRKKNEAFEDILGKVRKGEEGKRKPLIALSEEQEFFYKNKLKDTFELDFEEGKVILTDKEGKKIPNPNKAGEFLDPLDAFYQIAEEKKYIQNNAGGKVDKAVLDLGLNNQQQHQQQEQNGNKRTPSPKVLEHIEHLKALGQK